MSTKNILGENVRKYRELNNWSQEELAEAAHLHRTYISGIERGIRNPTLFIIYQLAAALNVEPSKLLSES